MFVRLLPLFFLVILLFSGCDLFKNKNSTQDMFSLLKNSAYISSSPLESDIGSKIIILNFWASWCAPCQEETPALLKLVSEYSADVVLISINGDADVKAAKKFMRLFPNFKGPNIFVIHDTNKDWVDQYSVTGLPETFIFDRHKKLIKRVIGAVDFKSSEMKLLIQSLTK